jgi:hypothetical protein
VRSTALVMGNERGCVMAVGCVQHEHTKWGEPKSFCEAFRAVLDPAESGWALWSWGGGAHETSLRPMCPW